MEGKLIKLGLSEGYRLDDLNGNYIASTLNGKNKLSLKNCQAIANGYDLGGLIEEVREEFYQSKLNLLGENTNKVTLVKETAAFSVGFNRGFKKALEFIGDKKFSEFDIVKTFEYGWNQRHFGKTDEDELREIQKRFIQSLQQTEWNVEVCCQNDCYGDYTTCKKSSFECQICTNTGIPKLDSNGCLILKRK